MNCCDAVQVGMETAMKCCAADQVDSALLEPCRNCPHRGKGTTPLQTRNGGAQVDTRRRTGEVPHISLDADDDEPLLHAAPCQAFVAKCALLAVFAPIGFAVGCWLLRVPSWFWE